MKKSDFISETINQNGGKGIADAIGWARETFILLPTAWVRAIPQFTLVACDVTFDEIPDCGQFIRTHPTIKDIFDEKKNKNKDKDKDGVVALSTAYSLRDHDQKIYVRMGSCTEIVYKGKVVVALMEMVVEKIKL